MASIAVAEPVTVAQVKAEDPPAGIPAAFKLLESRMPTLRGRKMYGVLYATSGDYFSCVKLDDEHPDDMGFERGTIPGGRYARKKIENWSGRESQIAGWFDEVLKQCADDGLTIDDGRPSIEFYRSLSELILMVPVK